MRIRIKLFANLGQYLPATRQGNEADMEVPEGASPMAVMGLLNLPPGSAHLVLINGNYVPPEQWSSAPLKEGDALAAWPPVAGG